MQIDVTNYVARTRMNATNGIVLAHRLVETAEAEAAEGAAPSTTHSAACSGTSSRRWIT